MILFLKAIRLCLIASVLLSASFSCGRDEDCDNGAIINSDNTITFQGKKISLPDLLSTPTVDNITRGAAKFTLDFISLMPVGNTFRVAFNCASIMNKYTNMFSDCFNMYQNWVSPNHLQLTTGNILGVVGTSLIQGAIITDFGEGSYASTPLSQGLMCIGTMLVLSGYAVETIASFRDFGNKYKINMIKNMVLENNRLKLQPG